MNAEQKLEKLKNRRDLLHTDKTTGERFIKLKCNSYLDLHLMSDNLIESIKTIAQGLTEHNNDIAISKAGFSILALAGILEQTQLYDEIEILDLLDSY